jgi:hypothetical protein
MDAGYLPMTTRQPFVARVDEVLVGMNFLADNAIDSPFT